MSTVLVSDLKNTKWKAKAEAISFYRGLDNAKSVANFFSEVQKINDEIIYGYFVSFAEDYLKKNDHEIVSEVIVDLFKVASSSSSNRKSALNIVRNYFSNPKALRYIKILALQNCFLKTSGEGRLLLTKIVGNNKFIELVPQVLRNFRLKNNDILYYTILVFVNLNDKRANNFIREYVKSENLKLQKASIQALGKIGGLIDSIPIYNQLMKKDELAITCLESLVKIWKWPSVYLVKHVSEKFPKKVSESIDFYKIASEYPYKENRDLLIDRFLQEENPKKVFTIEMYLRELDQRYVLEKLMSKYTDASSLIQIRILQYMAESTNEVIVPFLKKELFDKPDLALRTLMLEILAEFEDNDVYEFMYESFKKEEIGISYYYLNYILKAPLGFLNSKLEDIIKFVELQDNALLYEVVLGAIRSRSQDFESSKLISSFLLKCLVNDNQRIVYLALKAVGDLAQIHFFETLNKYVTDESSSDAIREQAASSIWKLLQQNPELVDEYRDLLSDEDVIKSLKVDKIKSPFFGAVFEATSLTEEDGNYNFVSKYYHIAFERKELLETLSETDYGLEKLLYFANKDSYQLSKSQWRFFDNIILDFSDYNLLASYYRLKGKNNTMLSMNDIQTISQLDQWGYSVKGVFHNLKGALQ